MPPHPFRDLGDRLDRAHLVVGQHDADQDRLGRDGRVDLVGIDPAVAIDGQLHDLEPELLQVADRVADRVVLDRAGDDAVAARLAGPGRALDREVVRLGPARREDDLARRGAEGSGHPLVGLVQPGPGPPAEASGRKRDCRTPRSARAASPRALRAAAGSWRRGRGRSASLRIVRRPAWFPVRRQEPTRGPRDYARAASLRRARTTPTAAPM